MSQILAIFFKAPQPIHCVKNEMLVFMTMDHVAKTMDRLIGDYTGCRSLKKILFKFCYYYCWAHLLSLLAHVGIHLTIFFHVSIRVKVRVRIK